jgi:hypothetical protein
MAVSFTPGAIRNRVTRIPVSVKTLPPPVIRPGAHAQQSVAVSASTLLTCKYRDPETLPFIFLSLSHIPSTHRIAVQEMLCNQVRWARGD